MEGNLVDRSKELAERYVAVWNEPDAGRRRKAIVELWAEDGAQLLQPPHEVREVATELGMTPSLEARGHDELEIRVTARLRSSSHPGSSS